MIDYLFTLALVLWLASDLLVTLVIGGAVLIWLIGRCFR